MSRLWAANSMTALTCFQSRPANHSRMSSIGADLGILKDEETGMRLPLSTHVSRTKMPNAGATGL